MIVATNNSTTSAQKINVNEEKVDKEKPYSTTHRLKLAYKSNAKCYRNCYSYGHFLSKCRTNLNGQNGEGADFAKEAEESLLLMCDTKEKSL